MIRSGGRRNEFLPTSVIQVSEKPMPKQSKAIAFDVDEASLISLREALPDCKIEVVNGASAASLRREWDPGTVDLLVVQARKEFAETLELCQFLVSSGVLARDSLKATDSQEELPKTLGLHRSRHNRARRPPSPLLVLVPQGRERIVKAVLKAGAHSCLTLPINAEDVASMLVHAQAGNQPGRHTLNLEKAQIEDRWRDDGGQG
jgi:DNA-binding NarL/FixJ family response regulator